MIADMMRNALREVTAEQAKDSSWTTCASNICSQMIDMQNC